ncbi:MAG: HAMP domain-containing protein [Rhodospirillaceae bacterium]|nr:HAMP domain-containing protein [Rhodospirillaceae bacterium]
MDKPPIGAKPIAGLRIKAVKYDSREAENIGTWDRSAELEDRNNKPRVHAMAGDTNGTDRLPGPMEQVRQQAMEPIRDHALQRTLFGGMSFGARLTGVISLGLAVIVATGGLFYTADQRSDAALQRLKSAMLVQAQVSTVQAAALGELGRHQSLLIAGGGNRIKGYDRGMETVARNLKALIENPATSDGQKTVLTLNDGFTQHAVHFHKAAQLAALLGPGQRTGLIGNARALGGKLEAEIAKTGRTGLAQSLAQLRRMEEAAGRVGAHASEATIAAAARNLTAAVGQAPIDDKLRSQLAKLAGAYASDLAQLVRMRQTMDTEVARIEEINAYVAPNIQTLAEFGGSLALSARQSADAAQTFVRKFLAGSSAVILVLFVALTALLMSSVIRPVRLLAHASSVLARGDQGTNIPALGNYDETGEIAHALVQFRENMNHAQRLRDELELRLETAESAAAESAQAAEEAKSKSKAQEQAYIEPEPEIEAPLPAMPDPAPEENLPAAAGLQNLSNINISDLSRQLAETSQNASSAAHEAERTEMIINGIADSMNKIEQTETLLAGVSDQMSLLVVQSQLTDDGIPTSDQENLILLADKRREDETGQRNVGQTLSDRIGVIQSGTNQAIRSIQQIGDTIGAVNDVALEFAAVSSSDALDAATVLMQQSEELRGKLDDLLGKIKLEGGGLPNYSSGEPE